MPATAYTSNEQNYLNVKVGIPPKKNAANLSLKDIDRTTPLHSLGNGKIKIVRDTVRECS